MEVSDEENLRRLGEEENRARKAFVIGFLRGLSVVGVFCKHKVREAENEKADFYAGQIYGAILISVVALAYVVFFWIPGGG